jgi:hypothetical protein
MTEYECEVWKKARGFIEHYCNDAPMKAASRADEARTEGKLDQQRFWKAVVTAINEMRRMPAKGERVN